MTKVKKDMIPPKIIFPTTRFRRPALLTGRETRVGDRRRGRSGAKYKRVGATRFERATSTSRRPTFDHPASRVSPPFPGKTLTASLWCRRAVLASGTANGTTTGTKTGRGLTAPVPSQGSPTAPPPRPCWRPSAPSRSSATPRGRPGRRRPTARGVADGRQSRGLRTRCGGRTGRSAMPDRPGPSRR